MGRRFTALYAVATIVGILSLVAFPLCSYIIGTYVIPRQEAMKLAAQFDREWARPPNGQISTTSSIRNRAWWVNEGSLLVRIVEVRDAATDRLYYSLRSDGSSRLEDTFSHSDGPYSFVFGRLDAALFERIARGSGPAAWIWSLVSVLIAGLVYAFISSQVESKHWEESANNFVTHFEQAKKKLNAGLGAVTDDDTERIMNVLAMEVEDTLLAYPHRRRKQNVTGRFPEWDWLEPDSKTDIVNGFMLLEFLKKTDTEELSAAVFCLCRSVEREIRAKLFISFRGSSHSRALSVDHTTSDEIRDEPARRLLDFVRTDPPRPLTFGLMVGCIQRVRSRKSRKKYSVIEHLSENIDDSAFSRSSLRTLEKINMLRNKVAHYHLDFSASDIDSPSPDQQIEQFLNAFLLGVRLAHEN